MKRITSIATLGVAALGTLLFAATTSAAQFYKWTDEQGVTHYSADPPPKSASNSSSVKVRTRYPEDRETATEAAQKPRDDAKKSDKAAADKTAKPDTAAKPSPERYADKCKQLQADLKTMEEHARISITDEKGEVRSLTEEEKQERVDDAQRQMKAFCQG